VVGHDQAAGPDEGGIGAEVDAEDLQQTGRPTLSETQLLRGRQEGDSRYREYDSGKQMAGQQAVAGEALESVGGFQSLFPMKCLA
jgi:hypothetical protein